MRRVVLAVVALLTAACGNSGGGSPPPPSTLTVTGHVTLTKDLSANEIQTGQITPDTECHGKAGYDDISAGAQVRVMDAAGTVLAFGELAAGRTAGVEGQPVYDTACVYDFTVRGVPDGKAIYRVEVGHRGALDFRREQFDQPVELTLGR